MKPVSGSCLCGEVKFECNHAFNLFHLCHCTQCQKATGSAHASNLFIENGNFSWISGEETIRRYDVPGRNLTSAFCEKCGSPVPYVSKSGEALVVPAGSLDKAPGIAPHSNIFWSERASWYEEGVKSKKYGGFPE